MLRVCAYIVNYIWDFITSGPWCRVIPSFGLADCVEVWCHDKVPEPYEMEGSVEAPFIAPRVGASMDGQFTPLYGKLTCHSLVLQARAFHPADWPRIIGSSGLKTALQNACRYWIEDGHGE